jgi:Fe-S cluster assembly iron-binding protein IscA
VIRLRRQRYNSIQGQSPFDFQTAPIKKTGQGGIELKINLSQSAIDEIKKIDGGSSRKPRIYLAGIGCSSARLGLNIDEPRDGDVEVESEGITFLVEGDVSNVIKSVDVNYESEGLQMGFSVRESNGASC